MAGTRELHVFQGLPAVPALMAAAYKTWFAKGRISRDISCWTTQQTIWVKTLSSKWVVNGCFFDFFLATTIELHSVKICRFKVDLPIKQFWFSIVTFAYRKAMVRVYYVYWSGVGIVKFVHFRLMISQDAQEVGCPFRKGSLSTERRILPSKLERIWCKMRELSSTCVVTQFCHAGKSNQYRGVP